MRIRQATRLLIALMDGIICPFAALVKAEFLCYDNQENAGLWRPENEKVADGCPGVRDIDGCCFC